MSNVQGWIFSAKNIRTNILKTENNDYFGSIDRMLYLSYSIVRYNNQMDGDNAGKSCLLDNKSLLLNCIQETVFVE